MQAVEFRFHELGRYSTFVRRLSENPGSLAELGYSPPSKTAFEARIRHLQTQHDTLQRTLLVERLVAQQPDLGWNTTQKTNLHRLVEPGTFVVSTAHQPTFLGGPAYIPVKIASAIALCAQLKQWFPEHHFVPIHWLGSEDHDFEELGKAHFMSQTFQWETTSGGSVGRMTIGDLSDIWNRLEELFAHKPHGTWVLDTLKQAFQPANTLAQAMRIWLNGFFQDQGLLILDGDDAELKRRFVPIMQREFKESFSLPALNKGAERFVQAGLEPPLQGREINLFHLTNNRRDRLEPLPDGRWQTKSGSLTLNRVEGASLVSQNPVEWSPNAVLRPLFQDIILPEIAFVGGGAEIAYWTQLQETFEEAGLSQPVLVLRSSLGWIEGSVWKKAVKAGFEPAWLANKFSFWEEVVLKASGLEAQLARIEESEQRMLAAYQQITDVAKEVDISLAGAADAERQKAVNGLEGLKSKLRKAHKQKQEVQLRQLRTLYDKLFPKDMLQEREESLLTALVHWGPELIHNITGQLNPITKEFVLLKEE